MISPGPDDRVYPVAKLTAILDALTDEGIAAQEAILGTGIPAGALDSPEARVSLNQFIVAYKNALHLSRDRDFAYHAGLRIHLSTYGMYGFAMLSSTNFRQTMRFAVRYHRLTTPLAEIAFEERSSDAIFTIRPAPYPSVDAELYRHIVEMDWASATSLGRDLLGPSFGPREVHAAFARPAGVADYAAVIGCPVLFGQAENRFVFDAWWLDRRPATLGNRVTYALLVEMCDDLLAELELAAGWAGKVRQRLMVHLPAPAGFEEIAKDLSMSLRSLRRRLVEENTSYRKLADEVRAEMAIKYLRETDLSMDEVAAALGFDEVVNFRRAFRRWTKATPAKFMNIRRPGAAAEGNAEFRPLREKGGEA